MIAVLATTEKQSISWAFVSSIESIYLIMEGLLGDFIIFYLVISVVVICQAR